jgi:hypothetical protein
MGNPLRPIAIVAAVVALLALPAVALAGPAPFFKSVSSTVNNDGALVVSFDERGLGSEPVKYELEADGTATYQCQNRGKNKKNPPAENKHTSSEQLDATKTITPDHSGRIVDSLSVGPPGPGSFSCPSGQDLVLVSASYTNIVLRDTTNGVEEDVPDAP